MPAHLEEYGRTWERHHPDWQHILWDEATLPPLRNQRLYDHAELYAPGNEGQFRSDIARYELLHTYGGIWVDTDMECVQPLDPLIAGVDCFAGWELQNRWVGNSILGSVPGHPFYEALISGLEANVRRLAGARPCKTTGPQYLTGVYRRHAKSVKVFRQELFFSYSYADIGTERDGYQHPDAYAVHHWNAQRNRLASA